MKEKFHEGNKNMNDLQCIGRITSITIGFCIYILIWRYALKIIMLIMITMMI